LPPCTCCAFRARRADVRQLSRYSCSAGGGAVAAEWVGRRVGQPDRRASAILALTVVSTHVDRLVDAGADGEREKVDALCSSNVHVVPRALLLRRGRGPLRLRWMVSSPSWGCLLAYGEQQIADGTDVVLSLGREHDRYRHNWPHACISDSCGSRRLVGSVLQTRRERNRCAKRRISISSSSRAIDRARSRLYSTHAAHQRRADSPNRSTSPSPTARKFIYRHARSDAHVPRWREPDH